MNPEKQAAHMASTRINGKSYFDDNVDVQKLLDEYSGTGKVLQDRNGRRTNAEVVYLDKSIGIEGSTGNKVSGIKIHHSKKRTHIVPVREGK
ncbi:polymorphic toxin type 50 domain-containing protein [Companilactobacillus huachuanensis]|uniref:polymorphic toxin type 50 domain-containing protein n=1 Tax=Companilactobacillus huachuanensis TaxID=2559914 RepID=UPI001CC5455D|nr:polymorphic toxin type 50 domain-containing protein [Companilactobacillus huachuanensis]